MNRKDEETRQRFDADAQAYEERIIKHVNGYQDLHLAILNLIPFPTDARIRILDLGIGSGRLAREILVKYPQAELVGVDFAEKMVELSRNRLAEFGGRAKLIQADFSQQLPEGDFDLIVMVLSLHHLEDPNKAKMIETLYRKLKSTGALLIGDLTKSSYPRITNIYMDLWRQNLRKNGYADDYIEKCYHEKYETEDIPATLEDHLTWLKKARFDQVEVFWKRYHFVGLGGFKGVN